MRYLQFGIYLAAIAAGFAARRGKFISGATAVRISWWTGWVIYPAMAFSALFAMHGHLFGQLMDVEQDLAAGRRTTAGVIGVRAAKLLVAALMIGEAAIAFRWFAHVGPALFMAAGAAFFVVDALALYRARPYPSLFAKVFFVGWNVVVVATAYLVWKTGVFVLPAH